MASSPADIIRNMVAGDAPTAAALGEATSPTSLPPRPRTALCPVKRVRVCVSNNENTRILFSMLRVLACNSAELDRISMGGRLSGGGGGGSFYSGGGPSSAAQRLSGVPPSSTPSSSLSLLRMCRNIRYPINLRNERRAMELLLEVTARALSRYPTSLAQDAADLEDEVAYPRYSNRRNAKLQVRGEKEVLHHFALWMRTAVHVIDIVLHLVEVERKALGGAYGSGGGKLSPNEELGYDYVIQAMEEDDDCHSTILR